MGLMGTVSVSFALWSSWLGVAIRGMTPMACRIAAFAHWPSCAEARRLFRLAAAFLSTNLASVLASQVDRLLGGLDLR
jgi:hypothetical protein